MNTDWHDRLCESLRARVASCDETEGHTKPARRAIRVLVVDDDPSVLIAANLAAKDAGVQVTLVNSGRAALECITEDCRYDLALIDLVMPTMTGAELIPKLREIAPQLPIMVVTGFPDMTGLIGSSIVAVVEKPHGHSQIFQVLKNLTM